MSDANLSLLSIYITEWPKSLVWERKDRFDHSNFVLLSPIFTTQTGHEDRSETSTIVRNSDEAADFGMNLFRHSTFCLRVWAMQSISVPMLEKATPLGPSRHGP
jgi:hypothetical protein